MVNYIEGKLRSKIASGFKGRLSRGKLRRENVSALDSKGNPVAVSAKTYTIEGIRESFSLYSRERGGIPEGDVSVLIILGLGTLGLNNITPDKDDKVFIGLPFNKWHQVRRVLEIDPANASCKVQAFEIPPP